MGDAEMGCQGGWIKLHITCDISKRPITSVQVTDEH